MNAAEVLQLRIVEALNANGESIDSGTPVVGKFATFRSSGIGLQGDFDVGREAHLLQQAVEESLIGARGKQARCATAEEDRTDLAALHPGQILCEVLQQGIDVGLLGKLAVLLMGIEIAVGAFTHTPGDVHVEAQGRHLQQ